MAAVSVKDITRKFDDLAAVDSISFDIGAGELFGLLGPNGAGKTTTIKMLCTLIKPTSGGAKVNGFDITKNQNQVRKSIGIVFQDPSLDENLTAYENLDFHGRLYRMPATERGEKIRELLGLVELYDNKDKLVKIFSGGMKRRLEIARGLLHEPKILFLDEPTLGLDPQTRHHIWDYIRKLNSRGITIFLTTHYMEEADALCERVAIIDHGSIVALDTPAKLKDNMGGDVVSIKTGDPARLAKALETVEWIEKITVHNGVVTISVPAGAEKIPKIVKLSHENNITVNSINLRQPTLEDVFLHYTGSMIREENAGAFDSMRVRVRARRMR